MALHKFLEIGYDSHQVVWGGCEVNTNPIYGYYGVANRQERLEKLGLQILHDVDTSVALAELTYRLEDITQ